MSGSGEPLDFLWVHQTPTLHHGRCLSHLLKPVLCCGATGGFPASIQNRIEALPQSSSTHGRLVESMWQRSICWGKNQSLQEWSDQSCTKLHSRTSKNSQIGATLDQQNESLLSHETLAHCRCVHSKRNSKEIVNLCTSSYFFLCQTYPRGRSELVNGN